MEIQNLSVTIFSDPGCPFGFSAEPVRRKLTWMYGDQLDWSLRMVGLAENADEFVEKGYTPEMIAGGAKGLANAHHMPLSSIPHSRLGGTGLACRAVVATRLHNPEITFTIMREFQRLLHSEHALLDEYGTIRIAAERVGLDPDELVSLMGTEKVETAYQLDMHDARHPLPAAAALDRKLATWAHGRRYSCPTYILERADGDRFAIPGFWSFEPYEVAVANLVPEFVKRAPAESVEEVLAWADTPLAAIEVAEVAEIDLDEARTQLSRIATQHSVDGATEPYWSLDGAESSLAKPVAAMTHGF